MTDRTEAQAEEPPRDLAAELALGVLEGTEYESARARAQQDPAFAGAVEDWEVRLAPLALTADPVQPRRDLWPLISARLPANDNPAVRSWRNAALGAGLLAAAFAGLFFAALQPGPAPQKAPGPQTLARSPEQVGAEPMQVALLKAGDGPTAFVATLDRSRKRMTISPGAAHARKDHDLELWMIPPDGDPQPLGVIPSDKSASMPMPDAFAGKGETPIILAVSVEPVGGSTTGRPTGPVIAKGRFNSV